MLEAWLGSQAPPLTVCSMCSGSDMPIYCVQELLRSLGAPPMDHRFSCELSAQKRRALRVIWPSVGHLYRDVLQLSKPRVRNDITGTMEATRSGRLLYAGFPCTDASTLNPYAGTDKNKSCVEGASLHTGAVFQGILNFMASPHGQELELIVLENVRNLDAVKVDPNSADGVTSNLRACIRKLHEHDAFVMVFELDPRLFGTPQMRARLWMLAIPRRVLLRLQVTEQVARRFLLETMQCLVGSQLTPVDGFLLPETDQLVQDSYHQLRATYESHERQGQESAALCLCPEAVAMAASAAAATVKPGKSNVNKRPSAKSAKWVQQHMEAAARQGRPWWQSSRLSREECASRAPGLLLFSKRENDILDMHGITQFPEPTTRTLEVSQGYVRTQIVDNCFACITPHGRPYITSRCRAALGLEKLRVQGLWLEDETAIRRISDNMLSDLAGNAFEACCCMAATFCGMLLLATFQHSQTPQPPPTLPTPMPMLMTTPKRRPTVGMSRTPRAPRSRSRASSPSPRRRKTTATTPSTRESMARPQARPPLWSRAESFSDLDAVWAIE